MISGVPVFVDYMLHKLIGTRDVFALGFSDFESSC